MLLLTKPLICPSRNRPSGTAGGDSGYSLAVVLLMVTLVLISLTVVLPRIYMEGQREREEELVFRGTQYARAIMAYHRQFSRFPASVSDLTKLTNGMRFLRREYTDPMTAKGKWRYVHVNGQGVLLDSKNVKLNTSQSQSPSGFGQSTGGLGLFNDASTAGGEAGAQTGSAFQSSSTGGSLLGSQESSSFFRSDQGKGTYIAGVASTSHKTSIRIWNLKTHYDEWEFLGVDQGSLGAATSSPAAAQGAAVQSGL